MRLTPPLPRESGRDYALRTMKDNIIRLELPPGSPISENEVAAELGLSRTPVREAFLELAKVRIIETCPQKKSTVALIDYDLVEEARFMRNVLEPAVVRLVCETASPEELDALRENVRLQDFYLENFDPDKLMELDDAFHALLFSIARKTQILEQIRNISIHFDRVRSMALTSVKEVKIVADHRAILQAIEARDPGRAAALMDAHLNRCGVDASAIRSKYPAYFK